MKVTKRKRKITARFVRIIAVLSMLVIFGATFALTRLLVLYNRSRNTYSELAHNVILTPDPTISIEAAAQTSVPDSSAQPSPSAEPTKGAIPISIDWLNLKATNKQIVGWLYCEDSQINYPVVQTKNNTYYLTHNAKRKEDQAGALFLDYRNNLAASYENLIIYGHRMRDGSMFGLLSKFSEKSYCDTHKELYLLTETQNYRIDVFACRTVRGDVKYFPTSFTNNETMKKYNDKAISQSYWQEAPQNKPDEAILITLATCSKYDFSDSPKLLVHGWAIPIY